MAGSLPLVTETAVALAAARPELPSGVRLDAQLGTYGQTTSAYVKRLVDGLATLVPSGDLDAEIVRRMRRHYQVASCLTVQSLPFLRADWTIECDDDDVREYLTSAYELVAFDVHRTATRALWAGYSPNALTWTADPNLGGIVLGGLRDLPPETCRPAVTDRGTYIGFVQSLGGSQQDERVGELDSLWLVEGMESGNLFGRSLLTAAYDPWADHYAIRVFHARYLERFGEPVVKTRAPDGMSVRNSVDVAQNGAEPVLERNLDRAQEIGENLRNHSVVSMPSTPIFGADGKPAGFAWDIEYLESVRKAGDEFLESLREQDKRIARAIFVPDLLISNSETGAYSLGKSHRDVWNVSVEGRLDDYSRQITAQILDRLRRWNFGDRAPHARLVFGAQADEDREKLWQAAQTLIDGGRLTPDVEALAARLGLALAQETDTAAADDATAKLAANPFANVGIPALIAAGVISRQEGRDLLAITGTVPDAPDVFAKPVADGGAMSADQRAMIRASLGLPGSEPGGVREVVELAAGPADVSGVPAWRVPQAIDPPAAYVRELNDRERRVAFRRIEDELNRGEAAAIAQLAELLDREHDRALRQLAAVLRTGTAAEILDRLGTIELRGADVASKAWGDLMRDVWMVALDTLREELATYAGQIPTTVGAEGSAMIRAYASSAAERLFGAVTTEVRFELLNAFTSGVTSRAGLSSVVGRVFDSWGSSEAKGARLTSRMLSAKALNIARRDGIERGKVPLRGAQYSAILDRRTCDLCAQLDETVIDVTHTDLGRFTPPVHHSCRCVWVWITTEEADFTPTWSTPSPSTVSRFGSLVL